MSIASSQNPEQRPERILGATLEPLPLLGRRGQDGLEVADHAEVDELEQRGLLVPVDRDDRLGDLHARIELRYPAQAMDNSRSLDQELEREKAHGSADSPH